MSVEATRPQLPELDENEGRGPQPDRCAVSSVGMRAGARYPGRDHASATPRALHAVRRQRQWATTRPSVLLPSCSTRRVQLFQIPVASGHSIEPCAVSVSRSWYCVLGCVQMPAKSNVPLLVQCVFRRGAHINLCLCSQ